ncbi:MAG: chorismate synthase [Phycisphaeraceae bacterium]|nr:chorismate synthase [Phycisphaeraceae bacterium]MBX3365788.1 chorismate synthase [Phycisphaeraceae bacterium]
MPILDYQTAGESHGPSLVAIVTGLPRGLALDLALINGELLRRQGGYGRGGRQRIERDEVRFLAGTRMGRTIASPLCMEVVNRDSRMDDGVKTPPVYRPRPGHADLAGSIKWLTTDCRETLERASARETAARVAAGAVAKCLLREVGIEVFGFVRQILDAGTDVEVTEENWRSMRERRDASETYCPDEPVTERQCAIIRQAKIDKDTIGGIVEAHIFGCPPGLGSCMDWRTRLDARLAYAVMGVQAMKAVEIGLGRACASRPGSAVHDPIRFDPARRGDHTLGFTRDTNNAGGTEGGITNGQPVVVRATMKPISTLLRGLPSVDLNTKQPEMSQYERSDICAVSAASVVVECVAAFEVARALTEKFPSDSMVELKRGIESYLEYARSLPLDPPTMTIA